MMTFVGLLVLLVAGVGLGQVILLNMAEDSVDDQYKGCTTNMSRVVESKYLDAELVGELKPAWDKGKDWWSTGKETKTKQSLEGDNYYIALYVYTDHETGIYSKFNEDTRSGKNDYIERTYKWYSLHFYLTHAVQVLKDSERQNGDDQCKSTYRGTKSKYEKNVKGKEIRLGSFTSSSLNRNVAEKYGTVSCFEIHTCHGAYIKQYSAHPEHEEVLIPPYETFRVVQVKRDWCDTVYVLESTGAQSNLNCAAASGRSLIGHRCKSLLAASVGVMMFIQGRFLH